MKYYVVLLFILIACSRENQTKSITQKTENDITIVDLLEKNELTLKYYQPNQINLSNQDIFVSIGSKEGQYEKNLVISNQILYKIGLDSLKWQGRRAYSVNLLKDKSSGETFYLLCLETYGENSNRKSFILFNQNGVKIDEVFRLAKASEFGNFINSYAIFQDTVIKVVTLNRYSKNESLNIHGNYLHHTDMSFSIEKGQLKYDTIKKEKKEFLSSSLLNDYVDNLVSSELVKYASTKNKE